MSKFIEISFMVLHDPLFIKGITMGSKIDAKKTGCQMIKNIETGEVAVRHKGHTTIVGAANFASGDMVTVPKDIEEAFATIFKGRNATALAEAMAAAQEIDMTDMTPEQIRIAAVRAASRDSLKPTNTFNSQNDALIQASRQQAAGLKTAQVSNPTKPEVGQTGITSKPKAISHAAAKAQMAAELKS